MTPSSTEPSPPPPRFAPGDAVRIKVMRPRAHCRTPHYLRGVRGVVERYCGPFPNPEDRAERLPAALVHLYRVRSRQTDVWTDYGGPAEDTIDVEIYENWLEEDEPDDT